MNANAYGGNLADALEWVEVATPAGVDRRAPGELGFGYRSSNIGPGEIVTRARFKLTATTAGRVKAALADLRERRKAAQPSGVRTFGSTFVNPDDERAGGRTAGQLLEAAGCKGLERGGARFSRKHANFIENFAGATTADVVALICEGRRRVYERFGVWLEPEVQTLGEVGPELWEARP
jgi:UDP-N-acetylmuramate dehydrogenase